MTDNTTTEKLAPMPTPKEEWMAKYVLRLIEHRKPKCSKVPNSFGVPVLVYPPYESEGTSPMHQAFYGCRQSDKPAFYLFGRIFYPTHWKYVPKSLLVTAEGERG